jgi:hypothetical protein
MKQNSNIVLGITFTEYRDVLIMNCDDINNLYNVAVIVNNWHLHYNITFFIKSEVQEYCNEVKP